MNTTKLNKTTQKARAWIEQYNNSSCYSVRDWYTSRVYRKESIEEAIKERIRAEGLHGYKVLSGNSSFFTCGYKSADGSILYIETAYNIYEIVL